jgi:hypothetical protein
MPANDNEIRVRQPARTAEQMHAEIDARQRRKLTRQLAAAETALTSANERLGVKHEAWEAALKDQNAALANRDKLRDKLAALDKGQADD